jgi:hypothetical protein
VLVIELNPEHRAWKNYRNCAFKFNRFFAAHAGRRRLGIEL